MKVRPTLRLSIPVVAILSLVAGALVASPASAGGWPGDCPEVMPVSEVTDGMLGTGYTVSEGRDPEPFDVEVLGVMENGIGPGRDLIVVDTDSAAIDSVGASGSGCRARPFTRRTAD